MKIPKVQHQREQVHNETLNLPKLKNTQPSSAATVIT